jgi:AcrR family transcriptional regulator
MPKVSDRYKEIRKQSLLDSADKCFAENGYEATTIDDIVEDSGTSKGAIYNYFESKEDIYLSLAERRTDAVRQTILEELSEKKSPLEKLQRVFELDFEEKTELERRLDLEFWINASRNENLRKRLVLRAQKSVDLIANIIEEGIATGVFKNDLNSQLVSELYWSITDGASSHFMVLKEQLPYDKILRTTHQLFLDYIKNK